MNQNGAIIDAAEGTDNMLSAPPVLWCELVGKLSAEELQLVVKELDHRIEWAARLRAYVDTRAVQGFADDKAHRDAVKAGNRLVKQIRKLLGYSYPEQDMNF